MKNERPNACRKPEIHFNEEQRGKPAETEEFFLQVRQMDELVSEYGLKSSEDIARAMRIPINHVKTLQQYRAQEKR